MGHVGESSPVGICMCTHCPGINHHVLHLHACDRMHSQALLEELEQHDIAQIGHDPNDHQRWSKLGMHHCGYLHMIHIHSHMFLLFTYSHTKRLISPSHYNCTACFFISCHMLSSWYIWKWNNNDTCHITLCCLPFMAY